MANRSANALYTPTLLALATQLADFPLDKEFGFRAEVRSRTCGSTIEIGVDLDADRCVTRLGMQVSACAIGQSSAAIMVAGAKGRSAQEIVEVHKAIETWLDAVGPDDEPLPHWPGFDALTPAWEHKGRHSALLLAWTAITQALSSEASTG
ncbi:MAG: iron-sulfur cluster assembly scaffold protein [Erythrobacter sp.]|uniref:iron-sulfur cluster assembly scaffold protein n=1 Tax=Erythrobacter sp. TaxID=1042 RepID=UPI0032660D44